MAKNVFDVGEMERQWLTYWEKEKVYTFNNNSKKKIYAVDTPPPTLSGKMHIGHAFSYSQEDFITRYKRMRGFEVFYPFGTDDNGLPTERLVERLNNVRSKNMSRAEFIKLCLKTLKEETPAFIKDWKDLGISCDYDVCYSTIDDNSRKISQESFIELYKKGLIYREEFPTIYCTGCQTPIAQAELEDKSMNSYFTTLRFKVGGKDLPIATTRPELLGACVAVFVNPRDGRYKDFVGKKVNVPLFSFEVPVIADESADLEKGTGVLMVCSYGDKYDVEAIKKHKLEPKIIFGLDGKVNGGRYDGLGVKEARKKTLEDLKSQGFILEQKEIEHNVNVHDRCGNEIEFLPVKQWFVKILDKKSELIKQGKKINWRPNFMFKRYEDWIKGLEWDWSISRDRHFGIPIPVWFCENCDEIVLADKKELPVDPVEKKKKCEKCGMSLKPENKVLDTWATSSLTPQIASSLVGGKIKLPYDLRPQAHDIIRTWAFYTIVKSLYHENKLPWENIGVSGFVTLKGQKMSKSKGNSIEPQKVMQDYGADALRYWAASSKLGEDMEYQEKDIVTGKKFVTKLRNASNFVFMNLKYVKNEPKLIESDRLFLSMLSKLVKEVTSDFDDYNYSKAKLTIDRFFWRNFTDNYLEIVKKRVYQGSEEEKESAFYVLYNGLFTLLKLFAPFTPFVTEDVYQDHFKKYEKGKSVHLESWPERLGVRELRHDEKKWEKLLEVIGKVRQAKSEAKKAMNSQIVLTISKDDYVMFKDILDDLKGVTAATKIKEGKFGVEFA